MSALTSVIGAGRQRRWHGKTKRLGGFGIDQQFELGGLLDRRICRFSFER
jgi:hypothetical protein